MLPLHHKLDESIIKEFVLTLTFYDLMKRIFYFTPGCFDRGGISRYCRYQLKAISQNKDNNLIVYSLFGRNYNFSEDLPYKIFTSSRGKPNKLNKLFFSIKFLIDFFKTNQMLFSFAI